MRYSVGLVCSLLAMGIVCGQSPERGVSAPPTLPPTGEASNPAPSSSRIDYFRQLLALSPAEREQALAQTPDISKRNSLRAKLEEYSKLSAEEREARLRLVEVWYYLQPLIDLAPAQRSEKLAAVPVVARPIIEERLKWWDLVPKEHRTKFLENELAIQYFVRLDSSTPAQREQLANKSAEEWKALEDKLQQWRARPQEQRLKMYQHFQEFFDLPENEKDKTLHALSSDERQKLQKSLKAFEKLPPHQRAMCIESFRKFSNLSKEERDEFLRNVERWQEMSPRDRQSWINLINLLPAPSGPPIPGQPPPRLPPGVGQGKPPMPLPKLPGQSP